MAETRSILYKFLADTRGLDKGTKKAERSFGGLKKAALGLGVALGGREVLQFAGDAVQAAISADEAASKFRAVFGSSTDAAEAMGEFAQKAGVATDRSQDLFATLGNLTQAQGFSTDEAAEFTDKIGDLAGDMASFNDQDPEEVFRKLGQAMVTTERESLKPYGIAISELEVKQRALILAQEDGRAEASKQDRALASYEIALEQAGKATGDLDRTSDSLANRQRRLTARWADAKVELGRGLMPLYEDMIPLLEGLIPKVVEFFDEVGGGVKALRDVLRPFKDWNQEGEDTRGWLDKARDSTANLFDSITTLTGGAQGVGRDFGLWADAIRATDDRMAIFDKNVKDTKESLDVFQEAGLLEVTEEMWNLEDATLAANDALAAQRDEAMKIQDPLARYAELLGISAARASQIRPDLIDPTFLGPNATELPFRGGGRLQTGGVVPGTGPRLAVVHGGERVIPNGQSRQGGGGSLTVNIGVVGDPASAADAIVELLDYYERINGPRPSGLGYGS